METKKSFVLYADFAETAHKLGDADAGKLFKMILDHANGEDTTTDNLLLEIAFGPIKLQMDRDAAKWQKTREARSEAGKKGGRPSKQAEANKANASFVKQSKANKAVNVNGTVTVTETVTENVNETKIKEKSDIHCVENLNARLIKLISPNARRTELNRMEASSLKKIKTPIREHDMELLEDFFKQDKSSSFDCTWKRKQNLVTILNNFEEQLDLAYEHRQQHTSTQTKQSTETLSPIESF